MSNRINREQSIIADQHRQRAVIHKLVAAVHQKLGLKGEYPEGEDMMVGGDYIVHLPPEPPKQTSQPPAGSLIRKLLPLALAAGMGAGGVGLTPLAMGLLFPSEEVEPVEPTKDTNTWETIRLRPPVDLGEE